MTQHEEAKKAQNDLKIFIRNYVLEVAGDPIKKAAETVIKSNLE